MKGLNHFIARWRGRRPVVTGIIVGIVVITLATLLALAFAPGLRQTRAGRVIRFWEPPPPPEPAVPPGALGTEMAAKPAATSGTITIDPSTAETLGLQTSVAEYRTFDEPVRTTGRVT